MPAIPDSTKTSLAQRLRQHARDRWPQLAGLHVRYHGQFAYVEPCRVCWRPGYVAGVRVAELIFVR